MTSEADLTLTFLQQQPEKAARILEDLSNADVAAFFVTVPARVSAPVAGHMANWKAAAIMEQLEGTAAAGILVNLPYDDMLSVARALHEEKRRTILEALPARTANQVRASMDYPEGTVGALMDPSAPIFAQDATAGSALQFLRQRHDASLHHIFIHDEAKKFSGAVSIAALLAAAPNTALAELSDATTQPLSNRATMAAVANESAWDTMPMRPVIGRQNTLIGGLSRTVLRHSMAKASDTRPGAGPSSIAAEIFGMYIHTCQGMFGILSKSGGVHVSDTSGGATHDR